jgi:dienelactone hydrolase
VGRWLARLLLALCFLGGFYFSVFPTGRAQARALLILPGLLSASQLAWQDPVVEPIKHSEETLAFSNGTMYLDIYEPVNSVPPLPGSREGLVVIPGVGDQRGDAQLQNFSETLAESGLVIMDLTTSTLIANRLDARDASAAVKAFTLLQRWPGVNPAHVGLLGFSAGGPLMCFAAADPQIRAAVSSLTLFGSYYDTTTLLEDIGRRALSVDGQLQPWHVVPYPLQVLANTIAPLLSTNDAQLLNMAFGPTGSDTLPPAQVAQLSSEGAAIYHLLAGDEPGQVAANLAALSPQVRALLNGLSPSSVADQISAPVYLLHDRTDQFVPFTESSEFAARLTSLHHPYDFAEFGIFQHVEVRADLGISQLLGDGSNLARLISEVVQAGS